MVTERSSDLMFTITVGEVSRPTFGDAKIADPDLPLRELTGTSTSAPGGIGRRR